MINKYSQQLKELSQWAIKEKGMNKEECDDFIAYCKERGMLNEDSTIMTKVPYTKSNCEKLYKENQHLVKKTSKLLGLTYKELAELIGYTEGGLRSAVNKNELSLSMQKSLEMILLIKKQEKEIQALRTALSIK